MVVLGGGAVSYERDTPVGEVPLLMSDDAGEQGTPVLRRVLTRRSPKSGTGERMNPL